MISKTERLISLALPALTSNQIQSFRAAGSAYDVPFATLRARYLGVPSRADTRANSRKLNDDEEQVLLQKVLQLSADGFPPQRKIVQEMANIILRIKNLASPQTVGVIWVANFVERHTELSSVYSRSWISKGQRLRIQS